MNATYIYGGNAAAMHLLDHSALAHVTATTATFWAGADAIKVELTTPSPSRGEKVLWAALDTLAREVGAVDVPEAAAVLDPENLRVLHEAIGMAFGLAQEVTG